MTKVKSYSFKVPVFYYLHIDFQLKFPISIKVPVFYCLMKKFKSLNFYQKFLSLILTNLDQIHRDLYKITKKKNLVKI